MRKLTLLTAALFTITALGSQSLTVQAQSPLADGNVNTYANQKRVVVLYGKEQAASALLDKLLDCIIPSLRPSLPDTEWPEMEQPDAERLDGNKPQPEAPETTPDNDTAQDSEHASYIRQIIRLVNTERAMEGLSALTESSKINAAAQVRAQEIVTSFSHTRPNGSSFATALKEQGVSYRRAGENIAWGQRTPEEVVAAWMNSPGHRANIMNPGFEAIGVGYYKDATGVQYWTQLFTS